MKAPEKRAPENEVDWVPTDQLTFDRDNPRLSEFGLDEHATDEEIATILWREMEVEELALSIGLRGYFKHEPMFVIKSKRQPRKYIVVEGNRRLAAVKILLDPDLQHKLSARELPQLSANRVNDLAELPVVITTYDEVWEYVGFRHINGPRPWGALSKAEYVAKIFNERKIPLEKISKLIGDRHDTVKRLYRGLMVLRQAEKLRVFDENDRFNKRLYFSHLYTALDYPGFQKFIAINDSNSYKVDPVPIKKKKELGDLCRWLFGSKSQKQAPLIRSQNPDIRRLDQALQSPAGIDALRTGLPLGVAFDVSVGDEHLFREALVATKVSLQKAHGTVHTGYDGKSDLIEAAESIYKLSGVLLDAMNEIRSPHDKRRRSGSLPQ